MNEFNPFGKNFNDIEASDLILLKNVHEGWYIEYKKSALNPRSYAKAISAMANTYGGFIFIGIEEESRANSVAGAFPGVTLHALDDALQGIRQGVTQHLNPQPHFEIRVVISPEAQNDERIICIHVPISPKAPIIHSDGRIYRRMNDSSEPVAENRRDIVEHLFRRVTDFEDHYGRWYGRKPELSDGEGDISYVRLISFPDYWNEKRLWLDDSTEVFAEKLKKTSEGISFSINYSVISSQRHGFVCRLPDEKNPHGFSATFMLWRDLASEFWLPLPSFRVSAYNSYWNKGKALDGVVSFLSERGYADSTVLDLSNAFGAIDSYFALNRKFQSIHNYNGETFVKYQIENAWRRIPALALGVDDLGWRKYGVPIILKNSISSPEGGSIDSFETVNLHSPMNASHQDFLLGTSVFAKIMVALGLGIGNLGTFGELMSKSIMSSCDMAKKGETGQ